MSVQDPELSAETPFSEHFMAPAAGDPDAVLAELKAIRREAQRQSSEARFLDFSRNGVTDAAGYLTLAGPTVPEGFRDRVVFNYIAGLYYSQTAAGIAVAFIASSLPTADAQVPTTLVRDFTATIPNKAFYDQYQEVVHQGSFFGLQVYDSTFSAAQYAWHVAYIREPLSPHHSVGP
jgi:hypothetical protein